MATRIISGDYAAAIPQITECPTDSHWMMLCQQVNNNGFTIEDEELSHLGSAVFPE